jgi:hypothetical protein
VSRYGGKLHVGHRLKRVRADRVHANQIIEWVGKRCKVRQVRPAPPNSHRRAYGSHRPAVILSVMPQGPWERPVDLHYWADEEVTVLGWSFGNDEGWS